MAIFSLVYLILILIFGIYNIVWQRLKIHFWRLMPNVYFAYFESRSFLLLFYSKIPSQNSYDIHLDYLSQNHLFWNIFLTSKLFYTYLEFCEEDLLVSKALAHRGRHPRFLNHTRRLQIAFNPLHRWHSPTNDLVSLLHIFSSTPHVIESNINCK